MEQVMCKRCVMDNTDPDIVFDENSFCNHCTEAIGELSGFPFNLAKQQKEEELKKIISTIKKSGSKHKKYDCVVGVSGGVDSSYVIYLVKKFGLRPLAVHLDNEWNTEISVNNIEKIMKKENIDLIIHKVNWEEFSDIQLSFLKAGVPDLELPSDHAIFTYLFGVAAKNKIKYVINGSNTATESILPQKWGSGISDWKYIKYIQEKFGSKKIETYPINGFFNVIKTHLIKRIKNIRILNYVDYYKEETLKILEKEYSYKRYDKKHGESVYTYFLQSYILPKRFNFDKRKAHLSSLICSNQITRDEALTSLKKELLSKDEETELLNLVCEKLDISKEDFDNFMNLPKKDYFDYPNLNNKFMLFLKKMWKSLFWK